MYLIIIIINIIMYKLTICPLLVRLLTGIQW